ncbi:MAG: hypothetical protein P1U77_28610, partial [Rubripirellula sp.]|nr:hypothetical protein [Rubripirellula sp.]
PVPNQCLSPINACPQSMPVPNQWPLCYQSPVNACPQSIPPINPLTIPVQLNPQLSHWLQHDTRLVRRELARRGCLAARLSAISEQAIGPLVADDS